MGAIIGGLLGVATLLYAIPWMENLPSLLIVTAIATGLAAYVLAGSARSSYAGIQMGLAWILTILVTLGPSIDLAAPRDRVIGIFLGIGITLVVFRVLWPEFASVGMRSSLVASLRHLASLSRFALPDVPFDSKEHPTGGFRWQVTKDFIDAMRLAAESRLEPQTRNDVSRAGQEALIRVLNSAQSTFLALLAVVRHRMNAGILTQPASAYEAFHAVAMAMGPFLESIALRVESGDDRAFPDVQALLARAEAEVAALRREAATDAREGPELARWSVRGALYESLVRHLLRLDARAKELQALEAPTRAA